MELHSEDISDCLAAWDWNASQTCCNRLLELSAKQRKITCFENEHLVKDKQLQPPRNYTCVKGPTLPSDKYLLHLTAASSAFRARQELIRRSNARGLSIEALTDACIHGCIEDMSETQYKSGCYENFSMHLDDHDRSTFQSCNNIQEPIYTNHALNHGSTSAVNLKSRDRPHNCDEFSQWMESMDIVIWRRADNVRNLEELVKILHEMHPCSKPRTVQRLARKFMSNGASADDVKTERSGNVGKLLNSLDRRRKRGTRAGKKLNKRFKKPFSTSNRNKPESSMSR